MTKSKMQSLKIREETFGALVELHIGSWDQYRKYLKDIFNIESETQTVTGQMKYLVSEDMDEGCYIMWIENFDPADAECIGTLTHECLHVATTMMKYKGVPINAENQEVTAYLLEYFVRGFLTALLNKKSS